MGAIDFDVLKWVFAGAAFILAVFKFRGSRRLDAPYLQLDVNLAGGSAVINLINRGGGPAAITGANFTYKDREFSLMDTSGVSQYVAAVYWHDSSKLSGLSVTTNNLDYNGRVGVNEEFQLLSLPAMNNGIDILHDLVAALGQTSWCIECLTIHGKGNKFSGPYIYRHAKPNAENGRSD